MDVTTPTPETDGQYKEYARRDNNVKCVDIDFARKLERERDAARATLTALANAKALCTELTTAVNTWKAKAERTCRWDCKLSPTTGVAGHSTECGSQYIYDPGAVWCKLCGGRIVRHL